ncbi:MAG TPA: ABC transporter permease, partial [Gemmatimonadaceae bacterium]|nr:ABC transporter permease [Gemmatimonadaceae bacterium]
MSRFRPPFSRRRARADAGDEVRFHLEGRVEELMATGLARADAEREARRRFGDPATVRDAIERIDAAGHRRRALRERLGDALRDLRLSARGLARRPAFALGVVGTLALGIGANTAIFSVADALLFRPPPYPHPEQLVSVWGARAHAAGELYALRERMRSLAAIGTYAEWQMTVGNDAGSFRADGADVSANMFDILGTRAALGTTFGPGADVPGSPRVVLLSHQLWMTRFGGDSAVVGTSLLFEGAPRTVIGVMPEDFHFPGAGTQLWIPSTFDPARAGDFWGWWKYSLAGRLAPGVTPAEASREIASLAPQLRHANTLWDPGEQYGRDAAVTPLQAQLSGPARTTMYVLLGVVFALLLVACANVANLVLVRSLSREREFAVRVALGSSRRRLVTQMLGETFVLAATGGGLAVALAWGGVAALSALLPPQIPRTGPISVDLRVLAFTVGIVLFAWLAFGLAPALRASNLSPNRALSGARGATRGARHHRFAGALTVVQLALAVVLVCGSGLLLRSLDALRRVDPGFHAANVVAARVNLPAGTYRDSTRRALFFAQLLARLRGAPGVVSIATVDRPPLRGPVYGMGARIEGIAEDVTRLLPTIDHAVAVSPSYFATMGIRLVRGRDFTDADRADAPGVAVISAAMAETFWPGADPIGRRVGLPIATSPWMTIVGVVDDVKQDSLNAPRRLTLYRPFAQSTYTDNTVVARVTGDPAAFASTIRAAAGELDRTVPVSDIRTVSSIVSASLARARFTATLLTAFALLALTLGAVGV